MPEASERFVAIVDYGMGNLYNVQRACAHVGLASEITADVARVQAAAGVIVPGVGAMPEAMRKLRSLGLDHAILSAVDAGTPFMGICLGLQLLMRDGTEFGPHSGLGVIPGRVIRLHGTDEHGRMVKVPHIGWNSIHQPRQAQGLWARTHLAGLPDGARMYFVHSYYVVPDDDSIILSQSSYGGINFCSAVAIGNIFACQFHPERSGEAGIGIYRRFAEAVAAGGMKTNNYQNV